MEPTVQVEALKLIQTWSMWQVTVASGLLAALSLGREARQRARTSKAAFAAALSLALTIVSAVLLSGAIPAVLQKLGTSACPIYNVAAAVPGLYSCTWVGVPLLWLISAQRLAFLSAIACGVFFIINLVFYPEPQGELSTEDE